MGEIYKISSEKNNLRYGVDKFISVATSTYLKGVRVTNLSTISNYSVFKLGDIAYEGHTNNEFPFGRFVQNIVGNGIISNIFKVFTPIIKMDLQYWNYAIKNNIVMLNTLKNSSKTGIMMNSLDINEFFSNEILFPNLSEQNKIGKLFFIVDLHLSLLQRKLDKLKNIKETLLEKMFV